MKKLRIVSIAAVVAAISAGAAFAQEAVIVQEAAAVERVTTSDARTTQPRVKKSLDELKAIFARRIFKINRWSQFR